jgi:protein disulfide-isomerase A1
VLKKVGPAHRPATCDEVSDITKGAKFSLTYFGAREGEVFANFEKVANGEYSEKLTFITNDDAACATSFGAAFPGITLARHFDEPILQASEHSVDGLNAWIGASMIPTIQEFSEDSIEGIFGERKQAIFLFRNKANSGEFENVFSQAATAMKGQIVFVTSDVEEGIQGRLGEFVGVTSDMLPTIRVLDPADGMKKFSYDGKLAELTVEKIEAFVNDFKAGNLAPFLKSEPIPETQEGPVHVLVGKSFQKDVIESDDDVLVKFYAPWCGHCKSLAPAWEEVAAELKDVAGLKIAKFDATMNEANGVEIQGYPTLKFYKKGKKSAPVAFEGGRTKDEIIAWLKENSAAYKAHLGVTHDEL